MRNMRKICGVWLLVFALLLNLMPTAWAVDTYTVSAAISPTTGIKAGDTVEIFVTVSKNGTEITDLSAAGLY